MHLRKRRYSLQPAFQEKSSQDVDKSSKISSWKGLLFATTSAVFYSIDAIFVKSMKNLDPIQLVLYRFIASFVMCLPEVVKCGKNPFGPRDVRVFLLLRGALGGISIFLDYTSFRYLSLGESFIIISSMPIFVTVAARIFLKEPCGVFQSILVAITVIGIIFTTKVPSRLMENGAIYTTENTLGILAALGALLSRTCSIIVIRKAKKADHAVMMFNYCWVSVIECLISLFFLAEFKWHTCGVQWFFILLISVINYVGQTFLSLSLKCELAGHVSTIMGAVRIFLGFLLQTIIFYDTPDYFTISGAVIVVCCILLLSLRKWVSDFPENSKWLKKLRWILI